MKRTKIAATCALFVLLGLLGAGCGAPTRRASRPPRHPVQHLHARRVRRGVERVPRERRLPTVARVRRGGGARVRPRDADGDEQDPRPPRLLGEALPGASLSFKPWSHNMRHPRIVPLLLLTAALGLCQCAAALQSVCFAAYDACVGKLGPACGAAPTCADTTNSDSDPDPATQGPWYGPDAINSPPPDACAGPVTGYGACVECVTTSCCAEAVACFGEATCTCLMAQRTPGVALPEGVTCGAPDPAYVAATSCFAEHCAASCSAAP